MGMTNQPSGRGIVIWIRSLCVQLL